RRPLSTPERLALVAGSSRGTGRVGGGPARDPTRSEGADAWRGRGRPAGRVLRGVAAPGRVAPASAPLRLHRPDRAGPHPGRGNIGGTTALGRARRAGSACSAGDGAAPLPGAGASRPVGALPARR